jgi:acetolactate synthase-1/2/3 large subunit
MIKLADYVVNTLAAHGIDRAFLVYGSANGDLVDAFTRTNAISYVATMTEQAAGFAAEGYAKVKGVPGLAMATSGPGGMNLVTCAGNAFYDSVPVIFITGQIKTRFLRPDPSLRQIGFQEADMVALFTPVTKSAVMVANPNRIRYELEKALFLCSHGRPGPVLLDLPIDVQQAMIDPDALEGFDLRAAENRELLNASVSLAEVDRDVADFVIDLEQSERPVLLIGGGVRSAGAVDRFREVAALLQIPCYPTWNALDVVTSDLPWYGGRIGTYGGAGRNFGLQNSDLLLAVGSRISGRITGGAPETWARGAKKYLVDIDSALTRRELQQVPFDVSTRADVRLYLARLSCALEGYRPRHADWLDKCLGWRRQYPARPAKKVRAGCDFYTFVETLSEKCGPETILVGDCGGNIVVLSHAFETKRGQRFITNNGNSPMGFSFAGALGAWFADPTKTIICVIGDGGFNMNLQEIQTLINYGAVVKTIILDNRIYGITKAFQETNFEGRAEACGPKGYNPPDFEKIAKAYGMDVIRIGGQHSGALKDMGAAINVLLAHPKSMICIVECWDYHTYEPRIVGWKTPLEDMYPYLPRAEFRKNMTIEPVEGWLEPTMPNVVG